MYSKLTGSLQGSWVVKWLTMSEPVSLDVSGLHFFLFGGAGGIDDLIKVLFSRAWYNFSFESIEV